MSTHDINGKPPMYGGMPSMSPAMIGNTPAYAPPQRVNNVIFGSSDDEYKKQLQRKNMYDPSTQPRNDNYRVAGVKYRPKTGERSISDVFNSQSDYPNKAADRSMNYQPYSENPQKNYSGDVAAGVRTGSPKRKNDSTVFAHLPVENTGADRSRRDPYEIQKPKHVHNNLSAAAPYDMPPGGSAYEDELSKQFNEYYKMQ